MTDNAVASGVDEGIKYTLKISSTLGLFGLLLFFLLFSKFPAGYRCRLRNAPSSFREILRVLRAKDAEVQVAAGSQAVAFLHYVQMLFAIAACQAIYGLSVLVPVHYTADGGLHGIARVTVANISQETDRLWVHLLGLLLLTFGTLYMVFSYRRGLRDVKYTLGVHTPLHRRRSLLLAARTVLVKGLPASIDTNERLRHFICEDLCPGSAPSFHFARVAYDVRDLASLQERYFEAVRRHAEACKTFADTGVRPLLRRSLVSRCFPGLYRPKDAITAYAMQEQRAKDLIYQYVRQRIRSGKTTHVGFVTFRSARVAMECRRYWRKYGRSKPALLIDGLPGERQEFRLPLWSLLPDLDIDKAPEPGDVLWGNLTVSTAQRRLRKLVGFGAVFVILFFWDVPVASLSQLSTLQKLPALGSALSFVLRWSPKMSGLFESYLPTLVLITFYSILPYVVTWIAYFQRPRRMSIRRREIMVSFFSFLVINLFLVNALGVSALSILRNVLESHKAKELETLGAAVVAHTSTFFLAYIIQEAMFKSSLQLLRPAETVPLWLKRRHAALTAALASHPKPVSDSDPAPRLRPHPASPSLTQPLLTSAPSFSDSGSAGNQSQCSPALGPMTSTGQSQRSDRSVHQVQYPRLDSDSDPVFGRPAASAPNPCSDSDPAFCPPVAAAPNPFSDSDPGVRPVPDSDPAAPCNEFGLYEFQFIYGWHGLLFSIAAALCLVQPLAPLAASAYFAVRYHVDKYNLLAVYPKDEGSATRQVRIAGYFVLIALLVSQFCNGAFLVARNPSFRFIMPLLPTLTVATAGAIWWKFDRRGSIVPPASNDDVEERTSHEVKILSIPPQQLSSASVPNHYGSIKATPPTNQNADRDNTSTTTTTTTTTATEQFGTPSAAAFSDGKERSASDKAEALLTNSEDYWCGFVDPHLRWALAMCQEAGPHAPDTGSREVC